MEEQSYTANSDDWVAISKGMTVSVANFDTPNNTWLPNGVEEEQERQREQSPPETSGEAHSTP